MPLLLTCECGARFEVDDYLGGTEVSCPACQQSVKADYRSRPRLDDWAVFSLGLALLGAFTLVGSLAALGVGLVSLLRLRRHAKTLHGKKYALTGLGLAAGFALLTLLILWFNQLLPVAAWVRQRQLAGRLDTSEQAKFSSRDGRCYLPRPAAGWLVLREGSSGDPAVDELQSQVDLLFVHPRWRAFVDLQRDLERAGNPLTLYFDYIQTELGGLRTPLVGTDAEENPFKSVGLLPRLVREKRLPDWEGHRGQEFVFDQQRGGQFWRFLVRLYQKSRSREESAAPIYVLRLYAPKERFLAAEAELLALADSIRFSP